MQRRAKLLVVAGAACVGAIVVGVALRKWQKTPSIVEVLPKNTGVVVDVDLVALRNSTRGREAIDALQRRASSVAPCAASVLSSLEHLGLAVPVGAAYENDFAVVGTGKNLHAKDVIDCAQTIIGARKGEPRLQTIGSFQTIDERAGDEAGNDHGVVAVRDGGPLLVGSGMWLGAIVDVADGLAPSLHDDPIHDLARNAERNAIATLTYALPPDVRGLLAEKLPKDAKPLAQVASIVAAVRIDDGAGLVTLDADAACEGATCDALKPLAENARDLLAKDPRTTLLGLRDEVTATTITAEKGHLRVSLRVPLAKLEAIGAQLSSSNPTIPELPPGHPSASASGPIPAPAISAPPSTTASAGAPSP